MLDYPRRQFNYEFGSEIPVHYQQGGALHF